MIKNCWKLVLFSTLLIGLYAFQDPFVFQEPVACPVRYRNLGLTLLMPVDSVRRQLPRMARWHQEAVSEEYVDSVFVRYRDVSQDLVDVPVYGQALPELYLEFRHNRLSRFKAVYKLALDNFRRQTLATVLKSLEPSHPQLADTALCTRLLAGPVMQQPVKGCEELMKLDTASTLFQLTFTYQVSTSDSL